MNKADLARFRKLQDIGCIACRLLGEFSVPEVHHLKSGSKRKGHQDTLPLCPAHHRGAGHVEAIHGPCLAKSPNAFHARFGTDAELLEQVERLMP